MEQPNRGVDRRTFLKATGSGLLAAPLVGAMGPAELRAATDRETGAPTAVPYARRPDPIPRRAIGRPMPELQSPLPQPPGDRVGYAVVGLGRYALNQIIPAFGNSRRSRLVALVSGNPEKARQVADRYGVDRRNVYGYDQYDRIRTNPAIQAVYIILPPGLHMEYSVRASQAGKHVLCEKPMANTVEECQRMVDAARAADRLLMIGYRAQFEPYNREAIEIVRERRELGALRSIVSNHAVIVNPDEDPADEWRVQRDLAGGGSLYDIGIYSLQAARYLSGEEPAEVSARTFSAPDDPRFREVEDVVHFTLRFPSGVLANCTSGFSYEANRFQVFGEEGSLELQPATAYYERRLTVLKDNRAEERLVEEREENQFALQIDHFSECIQHGRRPRTPGEEGLQDVRLMQAIYESARAGQPVRLA